MSIYGIGAYYDGDVTPRFVNAGVACIGWSETEAPPIYCQAQSIKRGDLIYIKSYTPSNGLTIKAIGIVTDNLIRKVAKDLGWGIEVNWIWSSHKQNEEAIPVGKLDDRHDNIRGGTLFEEFNPDIAEFIIKTVIDGEPPENFWDE